MNIRLSLILPCYNVEKYILRCLNSLYTQDIDEKEYEVICVNDSSTDGTREIILEYQKEHFNLLLIDHDVNKKQGAARNTGLKAAIGKYIWLVDADDYIEKNCIKRLLSIAESLDLDVLTFNFLKQGVDLQFKKEECPTSGTEILDGRYYLEHNFDPTKLSAWSKIYKRVFILNNQFYFAEGVYWEDADWVIKALYNAKRIKYIPDFLYYYCCNLNSTSKTVSWKKCADMVKMGYRKVIFAESIEKESPLLSKKIRRDGAWNATVIKKMIFITYPERSLFYKEIDKNIRKKMSNIIENSLFRFLYKLPTTSQFILLILSPLFRFIKYIHHK